jgi:hypothetical protein
MADKSKSHALPGAATKKTTRSSTGGQPDWLIRGPPELSPESLPTDHEDAEVQLPP